MDIFAQSSFLFGTTAFLFTMLIHFILIWSFKDRQKQVFHLFSSFIIVVVMMIWIAIIQGISFIQFIYVLSWFGFWVLGYMEFFSMLCRGFSLTILCDLYPDLLKSVDDIAKYYGDGKGADWLFQKRMQGLIASKMIIQSGERLKLGSRLGKFLSVVTFSYKKILKLGKGG